MSSQAVFTGFWINWAGSEGTPGMIMGSTLTLPRQQGAMLGSFLAMFTALAVANMWPIMCFAMHQWRSTSSPRAGFYHQQQAVLSNTLSPAASALGFLRIFWTWRREKLKGFFWASWLLILSACVLIATSAGAGIATARIQLGNNEVLAKPVSCGWLMDDWSPVLDLKDQINDNLEARMMLMVVTNAWARRVASRSLDYVNKCYGDGGVDPGSTSAKLDLCRTFTVPRLNISTRTVDCPFDESICTEHRGFQVEIGIVDSNKHLGINGDTGDSILFRKTMTCAPILAEEKFSTPWTSDRLYNASFAEGDAFKYYHLGPQSATLNYTFVVSNSSLRETDSLRTAQVHRLTAIRKLDGASFLSPFEPISQLQVVDSDITVLWLASSARYSTPVKDPWFAASNTTDQTGANRFVIAESAYLSDRIASALGCTEQYQFCTPGGVCSKLSGAATNMTEPWRGLNLTGLQKGSFNILSAGIMVTTISDAVRWLGADILRANEFLWYGDGSYLSTGLSSDHWKSEVRNMGQLTAAVLQSIVVLYATAKNLVVQTASGPVASTQFLVPPATREDQAICERIRVRNAEYTSFNVAGMTVTLFVGTLIILLNVCVLPKASFWVSRKLRRARGKPYSEQEWYQGHLLMQQRQILEGHGIGPWVVNETTGVPWLPTTTIETKLGHDVSIDSQGVPGKGSSSVVSCEYHTVEAEEPSIWRTWIATSS